MKRFIVLALILLLAGCSYLVAGLTGHPPKSQRIKWVENHEIVNPYYLEMLSSSPSKKDAELQDKMYKKQIKQAIINGQIVKGMTKKQVVASWGNPCSYCYGTRRNSWGDSWEYNVFGTGSQGIGRGTYVYFDSKGLVKGWSGN